MTLTRVMLLAGVCVLTLCLPPASRGAMPCQPQHAAECVDHMETVMDYVELYNSKHSVHTPYTSWGALCGASYKAALCITSSTKGCNSTEEHDDPEAILWKRFYNLIGPLNNLCIRGSCNVTAGTEGFTELVEANIKRILNPYKFNKDFCWYKQTPVDTALQQSIPSCTPYFTSHLAEIIRIFQEPLALMCDTSRIKCGFGTPLKKGRFFKICDQDADCSADNYACIIQTMDLTGVCCLTFETSASCDMTAIRNCFTKFAVKATVELTSVIPAAVEICSELNKTRSCVVEASVNCTSHVHSSLTQLVDTLQKHLDKVICVDTCAGDPCLNGGTCVARVGWHTCVCHRNFTGNNCESNDTDTSTTPSATSTNTITTAVPNSTIADTKSSRQVVLVVRLAMVWTDVYENKENEKTQFLIAALEKTFRDIYESISGFDHVQVQRLFQSSVGVQHVAVFDHDLSDTDRIATGLALTSALEADNNTLTVGSRRVAISGKTEMLVAEEKVEVSDACFIHNKKHLCQNGGTCVASQTSASCVCGSGYVGVYCGVTKRTTNNKTGIALGVVIALILVVAIAIGALFLYRRRKERPCKTHSTTPSQDDNKITRRSETDMTDTHLEMTNIKDDTRDAAAVSSANIVVSETPNHNN